MRRGDLRGARKMCECSLYGTSNRSRVVSCRDAPARLRGLCSKWNELEYYRKSLAIKIKVPGGQHEMTALEQRKRVMTKAALIEEIVKMEWSMFSTVHNEGGKAACQMDRPTFTIMRTSQHQTWNEALLASYRDDLARAQEAGRNLMTEKYGRMMKSTFPEEYERIAAFFPPVSPETGRQIEEIVCQGVVDSEPGFYGDVWVKWVGNDLKCLEKKQKWLKKMKKNNLREI